MQSEHLPPCPLCFHAAHVWELRWKTALLGSQPDSRFPHTESGLPPHSVFHSFQLHCFVSSLRRFSAHVPPQEKVRPLMVALKNLGRAQGCGQGRATFQWDSGQWQEWHRSGSEQGSGALRVKTSSKGPRPVGLGCTMWICSFSSAQVSTLGLWVLLVTFRAGIPDAVLTTPGRYSQEL